MNQQGFIEFNKNGQYLIIKVSGRFDFAAHRDFKNATELLSVEAGQETCIDLSETNYLDSSALGMILNFKEKMLSLGKKAPILKGANKNVDVVLKIAHFDRLFKIVE